MKRHGKVTVFLVATISLLCANAFADTSAAASSNGDASAQIQQLLQGTQAASAAEVQQATAPQTSLQTATPAQAAVAPSNSINDQAFSSTVHNMLPLTPDQIRTLRYLLDESQEAASEYPGTPPRPTSSIVAVSLAPGATPPMVRLRAGYVTSLVFTDATGAAWPISAYDLGDPKDFNVQWDQKGNTLMVQALDHYQGGNLAVMLKGLDTPIMLTLLPGQRAVDYRTDIRVPQMGPNANPTFSGLPDSASPTLLDILDGVAPQGAQQLQVQGGSAQAWMINNHIFLRTPLTVVSPGWISATSSAGGMNAYELPNTPVILASQNGTVVTLNVQQS